MMNEVKNKKKDTIEGEHWHYYAPQWPDSDQPQPILTPTKPPLFLS